MSDCLRWLGVQELLTAYDCGKFSPRELFASLAARIEHVDSSIGAFTALTLDRTECDAEVPASSE